MGTITRIEHQFIKPYSAIAEGEYNRIKKNPIEIYPQQQNAFAETFKEYPFYITFFILTSLTIVIPLVGIISGAISGPLTYYNMINEKNAFYFKIYKTIYESNDYEQFRSNYKKI